MTALELWRAEVNALVDGQHPDRPGTWKADALHRAACYEMQAREWEPIHPATAEYFRAKADAELAMQLEGAA